MDEAFFRTSYLRLFQIPLISLKLLFHLNFVMDCLRSGAKNQLGFGIVDCFSFYLSHFIGFLITECNKKKMKIEIILPLPLEPVIISYSDDLANFYRLIYRSFDNDPCIHTKEYIVSYFDSKHKHFFSINTYDNGILILFFPCHFLLFSSPFHLSFNLLPFNWAFYCLCRHDGNYFFMFSLLKFHVLYFCFPIIIFIF